MYNADEIGEGIKIKRKIKIKSLVTPLPFILLLCRVLLLNCCAAESWQGVLEKMPLAGHVTRLDRTNCVAVMLNAFQSNSVLKALIFMPGATDEFYMFRRASAQLTNEHPSLFDAVCALTNQTLIRVTYLPPMLLLHTDEDPLEPIINIEHASTAEKFARSRYKRQLLCNDQDWVHVQPILKKMLKTDIRPWRNSYDAWHFYRHSFAAWNLTGMEALEVVSLAGKTVVTIQSWHVFFDGDERIRAMPKLESFPK